MQETYSSEIYEYMKITVRDCVNSTVDSQRPWNPICKSETEKTKYLQQNGDFRFQVFQINTVVNPQKPEDYKSLYIDSDIYFQFIPKKTAQIVSLYYRQFLLENDLSILPYEDIQKENITVRKAEDFRAITEVGRDTDDSYSIVYLRRSPFTEIIHRKYEKLGELLAYLGGFMQIMKLVFGLIIAFYNRTAMLVELSNKLYDFNDNSKIQKIKTMKTLRYTNHHISSSGEKQDIAINQINNSEFQKIQWKNYVKQLIRKSKPITFNLKIFFNQLSFGYFFKNKNSEFLEKAMKKINTELDLHSILYQLQEINKLKQVLLRKSQIILFNFSPKPVISLGEDNIVLSRYALEDTEQFETYIKEKEETPKEELFLKLEEAYKEIAEEIDYNKSNICQMNINLKLINLIGSDMKAILKPLIKKQANEKNLLVNEIGDEEEQRDQT